MPTSVAKEQEKLAQIERRKEQLEARARALKASVRKKENARAFAHGGLVKKAGLASLTDTQLLGLLIDQKNRLDADDALLTQWEDLAASLSAKKTKYPIFIKFDDPVDDAHIALLKRYKLRWNRYARQWEGDLSRTAIDALTDILGTEPIHEIDA